MCLVEEAVQVFVRAVARRNFLIIADVIAAIASDVPARLAPDGLFICSGIINTKKDRVEKALADAGFKIVEQREKNDWMAYVCKL